MKKLIEKIKEKDIDLYLIIFILIIMLNSKNILVADDKLWNFANVYKMSIGYEIYNDLNVIITPLFFWIGEILFKILGGNYKTFTIYNILIFQVLFLLINKIFKQLKISKTRRTTFLLIIFLLFKTIIPAGANYNIMALIPILYSILLILRENKNYYLQGILIFITFMCKQNIGVYHGIGILIFVISCNYNITKKIKDIIKIIIVNLILLTAFILYLYINGNLYNFLNFAILGINEFGKSNISFNYKSSLYFYLSIFVTAFMIFIINSKKINFQEKNNDIKNNIKVLVSIGTPIILSGLPIINYYHSMLGAIVILIAFMYTIENMFLKEIITEKFKKKECIIHIVMILIFIAIYIWNIIIMNKYNYSFPEESVYYGSFTTEKGNRSIKDICNFIIENKKNNIDVKILSPEANVFMVLIKLSNREMDLPFLGNLGRYGEDGLIEKIKNLNNTKILIKTDEEDMFWQESKKLRNYIIENYEKVGEIENFSIFYIN